MACRSLASQIGCGLGLTDARQFRLHRLLARMRRSYNFGLTAHNGLENKKKLAGPTRFERVTFAFGEQRSA
jgi:hypothetical protein